MKWLNRSNIQNHIFTVLLFLLTVSIPFGFYFFPFSFFGIHLFGFRILLILSSIIILLSRSVVLYTDKASKYLFYFLVGWIVFAVLGYLYAYDQNAVIKEVSLLISGLALIVVYQSFFKHTKSASNIFITAWLTGICGQLFINMYEMTYAKHLNGNFLEVLSKYEVGNLVRLMPAGTFDNPNNLAIYILISVIFLYYLIHTQKSKRIFLVFLLILSVLVLYNCHSRIGVFVLISMSITYLLVSIYPFFKEYLRASKLSIFSMIVGIITAISIMSYNGMKTSIYKNRAKIVTNETKSDNVRKGLILNGIDFFAQTKGLGIGAGNFESYTKDGKGKYPTDEIINSHNWPIQLLAQYGIFILPVLLIWLVYVLLIFIKRIKESEPESTMRKLAIPGLILILFYLPISVMPSNFLPNPFNWLMLALIAMLADNPKILGIDEN